MESRLDNLDRYKNSVERFRDLHLTETDTRSKLIDLVLKDCLGWVEADIEREPYVPGAGYYDYIIRSTGLAFVIEAKRSEVIFTLPTKGSYTTLKTLYNSNREVLDQLRGYCVGKSIAYGVATNGEQFIISQFQMSDGTDWLDAKALIFRSVDEIVSNHILFFNNLSRSALSGQVAFPFLTNPPRRGTSVLRQMHDGNAELHRSSVAQLILPFINRVLGDIGSIDKIDDPQLFDECFVKSEETNKNLLAVDRMFSDTAPKDSRVHPSSNTDSLVAMSTNQMITDERKTSDVIFPRFHLQVA